LHLIYTRSYWDDLCGRVLGRPLHHTPTQGGPTEQAHYVDLYEKTLASYERLFGEAPPTEIWPAAAQRFGEDLKHVTVNTSQNWIAPKPQLSSWTNPNCGRRKTASLLTAGLILLPLAAASWNPLDWKGPHFLTFYLAAMAAAAAAALAARLLFAP